jgi:hypothetical protein
MWTRTIDGSVIDATGKVILFSPERFVKDICFGDCCFICGSTPAQKPFNNEHIIPEWVLRRYDLFHKVIRLPNDVNIRYDRYTVPCCAECNAMMGRLIEEPISEVIQGGINAINAFIKRGHGLVMFVWMGLMFLKTHLKDRALRFHLDARRNDQKIADGYEWEHLFHVHSICRCFYTECSVEPEAIGSFLVIPVKSKAPADPFDFADLYLAQTMILRLDDIGLAVVFNDSCGAMSYFRRKVHKITGPVSELQLREIMVELAFLNLHLRERPQFHSEFDLVNETCRIIAARPELGLVALDRRVRGALLYNAFRDVLPDVPLIGRTEQEKWEELKAGNLTFLFDDDGKFIDETWKPLWSHEVTIGLVQPWHVFALFAVAFGVLSHDCGLQPPLGRRASSFPALTSTVASGVLLPEHNQNRPPSVDHRSFRDQLALSIGFAVTRSRSLLRRLLTEHAPDDARQMLAARVVEHLEQSGLEIDEAEQVMRKRPPRRMHG